MSSPAQTHYFAYQAAQNPRQDPPVIEQKKNFFLGPLKKLQHWESSLVQFFFSIIYMILQLPYNIGVRILDIVQRGIRYLVWINIKSAVSWANFVYRCFAFFRVTAVINFIDSIVKQHFRKYSSIDFDKAQQPSRFSLNLRTKNYDLINVDMFEKRIKTPTFFIKRDAPKVQIPEYLDEPQQNQVRPNAQQPLSMSRQRSSQSEERNANPQLVKLSRSHERMKKAQASLSGPAQNRRVRVEIPNRTQNQDSKTRIFPDRDISPERYMKRIPRIGADTFQEEQPNIKLKPSLQGFEPSVEDLQCQLDRYPPLIEDEVSKKSKQQLQEELAYLRVKMQELINDNNNYIQQLQQWLKEKSQTVTQTRKENLELLQEMKRLQKQNIEKTKSLKKIQDRISDIREELKQQKENRRSISSQIMSLNEEIQIKSLQVMKVKQQIQRNYKEMQRNEGNDGQKRLSRSQDDSTLQNSMAHSEQEEQEVMEKLRKEEVRTYELAGKVEKLLEDEKKRVEDTRLQMQPIREGKRGKREKDKGKASQGVVVSRNGKSQITMTRE